MPEPYDTLDDRYIQEVSIDEPPDDFECPCHTDVCGGGPNTCGGCAQCIGPCRDCFEFGCAVCEPGQ